MRLLLDTCTLLWLEVEEASVPRQAIAALKKSENQLFASAVTGWEISIKQKIGKLPADKGDLAALIFESCIENRIQILPVSWQHATRAGALPLHHRDPFDRVLIAQALSEGLTLVSPDGAFKPYGVELFWD